MTVEKPDTKTIGLRMRAYRAHDQAAMRGILKRIGWELSYIRAFERAAEHFAQDKNSAVYMACHDRATVGFIFVEYHAWNRLAQIQGLAVDPDFQRLGVASALVEKTETFARQHRARGIYVDTPTTNERGRRFYEAIGYQKGYLMPRYYEDALDGVTYQKFFDSKS